MPRFRYTATNEKGKTVRGLLEAPSEEALYAKLRTDGLYMTDAQEAQKALATFRPLKTAVLADFCRNLGTLLTAGVPLVRAFRIMADERTIDARQKALCPRMAQVALVPAPEFPQALGVKDRFFGHGADPC